jgi:hypothetical protein
MGNFKDYFKLLTESSGKTHISVDVQPAYEFPFDIVSYYEWLNDTFEEVIVYINGEELGFPSADEHKNWLYDEGVPEEIIFDSKFEYREKGYAFFRACMDEGIENCLVDIIQFMFEREIYDSRSLEDEHFEEIKTGYENCDEIIDFLQDNEDMINIPDLMFDLQKDRLHGKQLSVSGGADTECLEEIRLALRALKVNFTDDNDWIY